MTHFLVLFISLFVPFSLMAQQTKVMVMELKSDIDPRSNRYVDLALEHATNMDADLVIIEMDTYGGIVTDAKDIVEIILDFEIPVYVFIDKDAASAGALISIACDSIYMAPGSSIGAATVVMGEGEEAPDKYQSYMRATMRATAEETGRDPEIAEAMVDESIEIDGITKEGQVLTFSVSEAIKNGFCEAEVKTIEEILDRSGIEDYELDRFEIGATEKIIAVFLNPFISGILILVIVGGIYFELQTPGVGFPILAAGIAIILYFVPYYLNGLAENWEIIAFLLGIILLALEIFVIPGFGIFGVSGLILTLGSLILVMLNNDFFDFTFVPEKDIFTAVIVTLAGILGGFMLLFFGGVQISRTRLFAKIALEYELKSEEGFTSSFIANDMIGKVGKAYTVLRPSGKVLIEDEVYDAYTRGGYLKKDTDIVVINDEGTTLKVKEFEKAE